MRLVIQRVTQASVTVSGSVVGAINKGYLVSCRNRTKRHRNHCRKNGG